MVSWPSQINGEIPLSLMTDVVGDGAEGHYMNPAAAFWFKRMQADCLRDLGKTFGTEEAYRSRATQDWYAGPNSPLPAGTVVASPGTSKHGFGLANDITGYNDPDIWAWLQANAGNYGFSSAEGQASGEKWHWVYIGSLDTNGLDLEEDDMYNETDRYRDGIVLGAVGRIETSEYQLRQWVKESGPSSIMGKLDLVLYLLQGNKKTDPSIKRLVEDIYKDVTSVSDELDKR